MILYGIPNCDSVKKARAWLAEHGVVYDFRDFKKAGVEPALLQAWVATAGWERVLNRVGTTFRKLPEEGKRDLEAGKAIALMLAHPSAIKRPILVDGDTLLVGFDPEAWMTALA